MEIETNTMTPSPADDKYLILQDMFLKGDDIQKLSIIQTLPQLVKIDQQATFSRIVPKIQQELPKASAEFQITTSQIFRVLIEKQLPINLLSAVIQGVDARDPVVSSAWMDTLLSVTPFLNIEIIKKEIIPLISSKSQLSQPVIQRVAACRIIGKISNHKDLKPPDIKKDILPFVQSLCQDVSVEVRAIMCVQLPAVAEGLTISLTKANLLPSYIELASDSSPLVREAAVLTMVNLLPFLEKDVLTTTVVPLLRRFCEKGVPEDNTAAIVSSQFAVIVKYLGPLLNNDDKIWFLTYFKLLSRKGFETRANMGPTSDASKDVMCRENCASNLPAVAEFVNAGMPTQIDLLYAIFRDLAGDPCYIVRKAVAACVHDIAKTLAASQNKMLKADIVRLLRDDAEDVLQMLVPNLRITMLLLSQYGFLSKDRTDQTTMEISRALLKCQIELSKGYNWRLLCQFIEQLECLPKCIPGDFIHQHFTPMVLGTATNGRVKPIVYQSTKTLLVFLRYNTKENQQKWLRDALINQFCYSDSCYTRQVYVKICFNAIEVFSSKYFKDNFFVPLLSLAGDKVPNVRYSFITVLPKLKLITLCPPLDPKYKILLQESMQKLEGSEKHKFVIELYRKTTKEMTTMTIANNKDFYSKDLAKQDEENTSGGPDKPATTTITGPQAAKPRPVPVARQPVPVGGGVAKPVAKPVAMPVDMKFLEQHFYIDAGVVLPEALTTTSTTTTLSTDEQKSQQEIRPSSTTTLAPLSLSETDIQILENVAPNLTDDVKVNLRKIVKTSDVDHRSSNIPVLTKPCASLRNKRHSSIFSTSCLDNRNRMVQKRHSLNLTTKDLSRIPVCTRKRSARRNTLSEFLDAAHLSRELDDIERKVNDIFIKSKEICGIEERLVDDGGGCVEVEECRSTAGSISTSSTTNFGAKCSCLPVAIRKRK